MPASNTKHVVVVGAGGNIGSHLAPHLGRMPTVHKVTLVDPDHYETRNLLLQDITPNDLAQPKATVQAKRLKSINPDLEVTAMCLPVESVPWGRLRCDLVLTCLDSRRSRQIVNQLTRRLGLPWLDSGVGGGGLFARVSGYPNGDDTPCLECAWTDHDYELIEQEYACASGSDGDLSAPPTASTSGLGALAASMLAIECLKAINDPSCLERRDILVDAGSHSSMVTSHRLFPGCRFSNHRPWEITSIGRSPDEITLADLQSRGHRFLRVERSPFVSGLRCERLEHRIRSLQLATSAVPQRCYQCGSALKASALDVVERLDLSTLPDWQMQRSMGALGLASGEIISLGDGREESHHELL